MWFVSVFPVSAVTIKRRLLGPSLTKVSLGKAESYSCRCPSSGWGSKQRVRAMPITLLVERVRIVTGTVGHWPTNNYIKLDFA